MFKDYVATENIFDTFECLKLDFGANISLKVNILNKIIFKIKFEIAIIKIFFSIMNNQFLSIIPIVT